MIDFRHETFLTLCSIGNYTKTAKILNMTQPAVTQHIQYLEEIYGGKLFNYQGKTLKLTEKGEKLFLYTRRMVADFEQIKNRIICSDKITTISFGATLTIGEFVMPKILSNLMKNNKLHFNMLVENTETLLKKLHDGKVSFVLLEGFFDKMQFGYSPFSKEEFIPVCSCKSPLRKGKYDLEELLHYGLVLRESGSGTRDILEQVLYQRNLRINNFKNVIEIGNMNAIKELVFENEDITFMYKAAVLKEIESGRLCQINIKGFDVVREFNFVYLKKSIHEDEYLQWFKLFRK